jgi:hypothetical protein
MIVESNVARGVNLSVVGRRSGVRTTIDARSALRTPTQWQLRVLAIATVNANVCFDGIGPFSASQFRTWTATQSFAAQPVSVTFRCR